jgi:hypothetical protein
MWVFLFPTESRSFTMATSPNQLPSESHVSTPHAASRLSINVDLIAVTIALALAALIRFNIIPSIPF